MGAANRHGHPAHPDRQRITAEGPGMKRLDHHFGIEAELTKAGGLLRTEQSPVDHGDSAAAPEGELIESEREVGRGRLNCHCCE